jgi:ribosomal-protein-alanine N-acetyltransferase
MSDGKGTVNPSAATTGATRPAMPDLAVHLRGERVQMVPPDKGLHLDNYVRWFNDPEITRYMFQFMPMTRMSEEAWFDGLADRKDDVVWAVHDEHGRHIAATGIHVRDWRNRRAITGIVIGEKSAWGRGYGSEIMCTRTHWAFEELGMHRLESECFAGNIGSATCLARAGYRKIGVARKSRWRAGKWHDCILWEMLEEDYFAARDAAVSKGAEPGTIEV